MKKYKFLSLLLILLALTPLLTAPVRAAEGEQEQVQTTAETEEPWEIDPTGYRVDQLIDAPEYDAGCETALLLELNSGIVAYTKNAESNVYPASLTKIMTCLVALEYAGKDLDKMVTVSETALAGIEEAGGELRLKAGERMTLRDVLYYLMVSSDNERHRRICGRGHLLLCEPDEHHSQGAGLHPHPLCQYPRPARPQSLYHSPGSERHHPQGPEL